LVLVLVLVLTGGVMLPVTCTASSPDIEVGTEAGAEAGAEDMDIERESRDPCPPYPAYPLYPLLRAWA
jgi:hypothetical protein